MESGVIDIAPREIVGGKVGLGADVGNVGGGSVGCPELVDVLEVEFFKGDWMGDLYRHSANTSDFEYGVKKSCL